MGAPEPGLVIRFVYLCREHEAGEESGRKIRPCLIVVAVRRSTTGKVRVWSLSQLRYLTRRGALLPFPSG